MAKKNIYSNIVSVIEEVSGSPFSIDESSMHDDLLKTGTLDSMGFIDIIIEIGSRYNIEVTDEDIIRPEHTTVSGLCKMVSDKIEIER